MCRIHLSIHLDTSDYSIYEFIHVHIPFSVRAHNILSFTAYTITHFFPFIVYIASHDARDDEGCWEGSHDTNCTARDKLRHA